VLILIYRKVAMLRSVGAFSAWLGMVVRRTCWRLARHVLGAAVPLNAIADSSVFASRSDEDLRLDLTSAVQSLPEPYRRIVLMRNVQELTIDEIGEALSLTREAVKGGLNRARRLLREYILK
jgi:RNA polymerase sigma factor (sigma-70 family)